MKLYALTDFPDDCSTVKYTPEMMDTMIKTLSELGIKRMYYQYYGSLDDGFFWSNVWDKWKAMKETAELTPNMSRVFVDACKRYGLESAGIMRPLEHGHWLEFSPYHKKEFREGLPGFGGSSVNPSSFLKKHPEMRIKRRTFDIDGDAESKTVREIKLYKQNNVPTRIKKEDLTVYVSPDNSYYKPIKDDFSFEITAEEAKEDVLIAHGSFSEIYNSELLCKKGDPICVIRLKNLNITEKFIAIGIHCKGECTRDEHFINTQVNGIACFDAEGKEISATRGGTAWAPLGGGSYLDEGFHFDDGFGTYTEFILDPKDKEGYIAIAKGKNLYNHGALCECEPLVQKEWMKYLDHVIDDGYDVIGNRIECHSVMVNEPYAYGYNDSVKELYYKRYGKCDEKDMDTAKIAKIRGDVYSELFIEGARRARERGKRVYVTLNIEMLRDPIPQKRVMAYPMNVEWQWERWLEEIRPDEINLRMYQLTPEFLLSDPQCRRMIDVARSYNVPITVERYVTPNIVNEYKLLNDTGLFSAIILYETADMFSVDSDGSVKLQSTHHGFSVKDALYQLSELATRD